MLPPASVFSKIGYFVNQLIMKPVGGSNASQSMQSCCQFPKSQYPGSRVGTSLAFLSFLNWSLYCPFLVKQQVNDRFVFVFITFLCCSPSPQVSPLPLPRLTNLLRMNSSSQQREERVAAAVTTAAVAVVQRRSVWHHMSTPTLPRRPHRGWAGPILRGSFLNRRSCTPSCVAWAKRVTATPTETLATTTTAHSA